MIRLQLNLGIGQTMRVPSKSDCITNRTGAHRLVVPLFVLLLSRSGSLFAQAASESRYRTSKDSAIRSLTARVKRGEAFATYKPAHDSALKELDRRLRVIIGPVQAKNFPSPGHINTDDLFPDEEDSGGLGCAQLRNR